MKKVFKPRARLLLQLGNQLIKNENIAVVELVKNSYDADASSCEILLKNVDIEDSEIVIKDDGIGMTPEVVEQIWLEPGADYKDLVIKGQLSLLEFKYAAKRTPIGEKGIGRFGVHKLGDSIEMITKNKDSNKEVIVKIDWDTFKKAKYLEDATFDVNERNPKVFTGHETGTIIKVKKIKGTWDKKLFRELYRTIISLNSPFAKKSKDEFTAELKLDLNDKNVEKEWKETMLKISDIKNNALWRLKCVISGDKIKKFKYEFIPYATMDKLSKNVITEKDKFFIKHFNKLRDSDNKNIDLSVHDIGKIELEMYVFYLGNKILRLGTVDSGILNKFLIQNGGVRVYRDNMRIYNYGEREDDWLSLDQQRVSSVGGKIGNKLILGAVSLDRKNSLSLIEKTNREGFVENDAYKTFKEATLQVIRVFNNLRNIDKEKIKEIYESSPKSQSVPHDVDTLKETTENKIKELSDSLSPKKKKEAEAIKKEIVNGLENIKSQYIKTHDILIRSAGAGLSLGVVLHEIEKRVKELAKTVGSDDFDIIKIKTIVITIQKLIKNYSVLLGSKGKKNISVKKVINDAMFNVDFRLKAHEICIENVFNNKRDIEISCSQNIIVGALINIFDNSLYWLNSYGIKDKKIFIDYKLYKEEVGIIIADNGKGFLIDPEDAIKPFVSMKTGGTGLGLHVVDEMMKAHKGRLVIRDFKEMSKIPKEFSDGAIIELIFKKVK